MKSSIFFGFLCLAGCDAFGLVSPLRTSARTQRSTATTNSNTLRPATTTTTSGTNLLAKATKAATPLTMKLSGGGPISRQAAIYAGLASIASIGLWLGGGTGGGVGVFGPEAAGAAQRVGNGGPPFSGSGYDLTPLTADEVGSRVDKLTELQKIVLVQAGTERPFQGKTVNGYSGATKAEGTWVSAVSGVPLFSSSTKFDSGTGWPSFYAPVDPEHVVERIDPKDSSNMPKFLQRTEVLDRKSGTHLGHVFDDGPRPTGKRYCMNAASMAFIPKEEPLPVMPSFKP